MIPRQIGGNGKHPGFEHDAVWGLGSEVNYTAMNRRFAIYEYGKLTAEKVVSQRGGPAVLQQADGAENKRQLPVSIRLSSRQ